MKKILTVSLFAVMAVSAAHAKIASVEYVDPKFQAIDTKIGEVQYTGDSLTGAISALQTEVGAMSGDGGTVTTQINAAKDAAIQAAAADATSKADAAEANAKQYAADGLLLKEDVANKVATDSAYSQLSPEQQAKAYPTYGAMVTYVGNVQNNLNTDVAVNANAIEILNGDENEAGSVAAAVKAEADRAKLAEQANTNAIAAEKTRAEAEESRIEGLVTAEAARADAAEKANAQAIADMKDATKDGSLAKQVAALDTAKQDKSGANYAVGTSDGQWTTLGTLSADCATEGVRCALVSVGGNIQWEVVQN